MCAAARALGQVLQGGDRLLLDGPMGAGKTTFVRALAEGLGVFRPARVRSPTFNICLQHAGSRPLAHVDLFRLGSDGAGEGTVPEAAFESLGLDDLLDPRQPSPPVVVIEWAGLLREPPDDRLAIRLTPLDDPQRRAITVEATGPRSEARLDAWARQLADAIGLAQPGGPFVRKA